MHKGSGWGLICIYAKRRMRFGHWQISVFAQRFAASPRAAISSTIGRIDWIAISCARSTSLVDRSKRIPRYSRYVSDVHARRPLRLSAVEFEKSRIQWHRWLKKRKKERSLVRTRTRLAWVCNGESIRTEREEKKRKTERDLFKYTFRWNIRDRTAMGVAREKISYRALINYTWFCF